MKVLIYCGGKGTRLGNTEDLPKPLVKIDDKFPILYYIMRSFAIQGFKDFVLLCGYKLYEFEIFAESWMIPKTWNVEVLDTGEETQTGGRLYQYIDGKDPETFFLTYGDGISTVELCDVYHKHMETGAIVTITSVHPPSRFGLLELNGDRVVSFSEKPANAGWINGGFMLIDSAGLKPYYNHIADKDSCNFEKDILPLLTNDGQVFAYQHLGFWQCMDTPRDVEYLRELRKSKKWTDLFG